MGDQALTAAPLWIVVCPSTGRSGARFDAHLEGRCLGSFREPLFASARVLLAEGVAPETVIFMQHKGDAYWSLRSTVGAAAASTILENDHIGPRLVKYRPFKGPQNNPPD
jgi:hypothetical protein